MRDHALLGPWVRRFLLEHISERNLSRHTQASYRDTLALLIPFVADTTTKPVDQLCVVQFSAVVVRQFLTARGMVWRDPVHSVQEIHPAADPLPGKTGNGHIPGST